MLAITSRLDESRFLLSHIRMTSTWSAKSRAAHSFIWLTEEEQWMDDEWLSRLWFNIQWNVEWIMADICAGLWQRTNEWSVAEDNDSEALNLELWPIILNFAISYQTFAFATMSNGQRLQLHCWMKQLKMGIVKQFNLWIFN